MPQPPQEESRRMMPVSADYTTPQARAIHPSAPSRKILSGLTPQQRAQVHQEHHTAWLHHRTQGIGASDASTILGVNPNSSLTRLYAEKTQGYTSPDNPRMRLGREMEDIAVARWVEDTGTPVRRCGLLAHREQPWMRATPDRLTGDGAGLEVKTTTWRDHRDQWDDQPSDHAMAQSQWCMAVTGLERWHIIVLFRDTGEHRSYTVERDDGLIEVLVARASEFWHGNILQRCAPALDGAEATMEATRILHGPETIQAEEVDGGEQAAMARRRLARIESQIKTLQAEERHAKAEMIAMTGHGQILKANGTKLATYKANGNFRAKDYTRDHPEKASRYMRTIEKLDHKAALADDPDAADYIPRVLRLSRIELTVDPTTPAEAV